jgi:tol-pal system-associated acyl-CoA thioesterase
MYGAAATLPKPGAERRGRSMAEKPQRILIRVYYEDTDFSGFVQHIAYLRFFERGRTEFLRAHGIDQSALFAKRALVFVVRSIHVEYSKPARMDDELWVETALGKLGGASIEMTRRRSHAARNCWLTRGFALRRSRTNGPSASPTKSGCCLAASSVASSRRRLRSASLGGGTARELQIFGIERMPLASRPEAAIDFVTPC